MEIKEILEKFKQDKISIEEAEKEIKNNGYEDLGYAKIDHNRKKGKEQAKLYFVKGNLMSF